MLSTITSKGQVTIPVEVRRAVGLDVGMQVEFIVNTQKRIELVPRHGDIRALRGLVPAPTVPVSVDDMNDTINEAWAKTAATTLAVHEEVPTYRVTPRNRGDK